MSGGGEKTEKATPKRQQDLRKKGSVARSAELPAGLGVLAMVVVLPTTVHRLADAMRTDMTTALSHAGQADLSTAKGLTALVAGDAVRAMAPMLAVVGAAGVLASVVVTRSKPNLKALRPRMDRISPKAGLKRLFSPQSLFDLLKSTGKLAALTAVAIGSWRSGYAALTGGAGTLEQLLNDLSHALHSLLVRAALLAVLAGVIDAWWSRRRFGKQARMSKQEVKEEHKTQEGNPHVKGQIRARQAKMSRSRMVEAIRKADVVLANPTHLVVALSYAPGTAAPVIVAKGAGVIADRLKAEARKHEVPIIENKPLARALYRASEIGDAIPVELYRAVAEVLAVVFAARRRRRRVA